MLFRTRTISFMNIGCIKKYATTSSVSSYLFEVFANSCPGIDPVPRVSVKASFVPSPDILHRLSGASQSVPAFSPSLRYKKHKYEANV